MLVACRLTALIGAMRGYAGLVALTQIGALTQIRLAFKARG
jgi:hypothetical protein